MDSESGIDPLRLDLQLCFALYEATNLVTRLYRPLLEPLGITYLQYLTLMVLWERDGRTVSDLGDALRLDSGTLTPLLKRLETAELVTRRRDAADERRVIISLTAKGVALRADAACIPAQIVTQLQMPVEDLVPLHGALKRLSAALGN